MGYHIRSPFEALHFLKEAEYKDVKYVCFFALDNRPSSNAKISMLNECLFWIDELSAKYNIITLLFARTETEYASNYQPCSMEKFFGPPIDQAFEELLPLNTLYINPTFLIAESLGLSPEDFPAVLFFTTSKEDKKAKYIKLPEEVFNSSEKLEAFLLALFRQIHTNNNWRSINFDLEFFQTKSNDLLKRIEPVKVPIESNYISFKQRQSIKIFISYAAEDREEAINIYENLKIVGFDPWMDVFNLIGGQLWEEGINESIEKAHFFLACLSQKSVRKRSYIQREFKKALELWQYKLNSDIFVLPVRMDNCEIPQEFQKFHWIDYNNGGGLTDIVASIQKGLERNY